MNNLTEDYLFKIIIIGNINVGKTNIIQRYILNQFNENLKNTIGVDFFTKNIKIKDENIKIQFWDTAGQERYKAINKNFYKNVNGIIIVFDLTNKESFLCLKKYISEIEKNCDNINYTEIIILANKSDLKKKREVKNFEIHQFESMYDTQIIEISAKLNLNNLIHQTLDKFIDRIYIIYKNNTDIGLNKSLFLKSNIYRSLSYSENENINKKKCCF